MLYLIGLSHSFFCVNRMPECILYYGTITYFEFISLLYMETLVKPNDDSIDVYCVYISSVLIHNVYTLICIHIMQCSGGFNDRYKLCCPTACPVLKTCLFLNPMNVSEH